VRWSALAVGCGIAACSAPVIEMTLELPNAATTAAFDLSCVGAARITVISNKLEEGSQAEEHTQCFDFAEPLHSFDDVAVGLRGKFTFDVPRDGLAGVQLTGFSGRCNDTSTRFESVFYGGAPSAGDRTLVIPVHTGLSCGTEQSYKVRAIDLTALYASSPSNVTCVPPPDAMKLYTGFIRPRMLGTSAPPMMFEYGASALDTSDGMGKLQSFRPVDADPACVAIGYSGSASKGGTCIRPPEQAHGLCGVVDEVEVVAVPLDVSVLSIDPTLSMAYGESMFGAVWDASTRTPITDATVELLDPALGKVVYIDVGIDAGVSPPRLRRMAAVPGATSTAAGGGFLVYVRGTVTTLIVKAPNHVTQTIRIAVAPDEFSTTIVALARQ